MDKIIIKKYLADGTVLDLAEISVAPGYYRTAEDAANVLESEDHYPEMFRRVENGSYLTIFLLDEAGEEYLHGRCYVVPGDTPDGYHITPLVSEAAAYGTTIWYSYK